MRVTALLAALLVLAFPASAQQAVRIIDVVLVSTAAVVIAAVRVRRKKHQARVAAIAEIAQRAVLLKLPSRVGRVAAGARYESEAQDTVVAVTSSRSCCVSVQESQ